MKRITFPLLSNTLNLLGRITLLESLLFWIARRYFSALEGSSMQRPKKPRMELFPDTLKDCEIDVVYFWVDSSDPTWLKKFQEHSHSKIDNHSSNLARFQSSGEFCASLAQLSKNASWVRQVFVVTDDQTPTCLSGAGVRFSFPVTIVHHSDIVPKEKLPLFNTQAILAHVDNIPGLSETFLFMNDDFFIARPVGKSDFLFPNGVHRYRYTTTVLESGPLEASHVLFSSRMNSVALAQRLNMPTSTNYLQHSPYVMSKTIMTEIWKHFSVEMDRLSRSKFRAHDDFIIEWLHNFIAIGTGRGVPTLDPSYKYIDVTDWGSFSDLLSMIAIRRHKFFCINDNADNSGAMPRDRMRSRIQNFLKCLEE